MTIDTPTNPNRRRRGRWMLLLVLAIGFLPFVLAQVMFFIRPVWMQEMFAGDANNSAQILDADVSLAAVIPGELLSGSATTSAHGQWTLMMRHEGVCGARCLEQLTLLRQLYLTQGRHFESLQAMALFDQGALDESLLARLGSDFSVVSVYVADSDEAMRWLEPLANWREDPQRGYLLLDRRGRPALHFSQTLDPSDARKDLARIMRLNNS
ncbi:hypothetical protein OAS86_04785 [Gammaproteobacteria bacterium]|nr:hypothetical protein [Gammaproteobacteria bacterium]